MLSPGWGLHPRSRSMRGATTGRAVGTLMGASLSSSGAIPAAPRSSSSTTRRARTARGPGRAPSPKALGLYPSWRQLLDCCPCPAHLAVVWMGLAIACSAVLILPFVATIEVESHAMWGWSGVLGRHLPLPAAWQCRCVRELPH